MTLLLAARLIDGDRTLDIVPRSGVRAATLDFGFPSVRASVQDRPGRHGVNDITRLHGARSATLGGHVAATDGKSFAEWFDELAWFLHPSRRPVLEFRRPGQDARRMVLRADSFSAPLQASRPNHPEFSASWIVPSGREEAAEESVRHANPEEGEAGRSYNLTFDRAYPASTGLGTIQVVNEGTADADPVLRIFGPCTDPQVTNETTGQTLKFDDITVAIGDWLEIDTAEATVLLNGSAAASRFQFVDFPGSSFWPLVPGPNIVRFHPQSSSSPSVAEVRYRSQWL